MTQSITVLGDGGWGTALALKLLLNGHHVTLWGPFAAYLNEVRSSRENRKFLAGVSLPGELVLEADSAKALAGADGVVLAVPSKFYRTVLEKAGRDIPPQAHLLSVSKGLDPTSHHRLSEVASKVLGHPRIAVLSGPSHAEEVARNTPTAVTIASADLDEAVWWQTAYNSTTFRIYTATDVTGVEMGGALKNVIAIAAGISDGLGFGDNTKAALMTRGLAEITRMGAAMGADPATFSGLSGIGDLMVTCMSRHSRNRGVGERIGKGESMASILGGMDQVAEGVWTAKEAVKLAADLGVDLPICAAVAAVIEGTLGPGDAVQQLMGRDPKPEFH